MSSKHSSAGGSRFLSAFRYTIGFIERLVHNFFGVQVKWTYRQCKRAHRELSNLHLRKFGRSPHFALSISAGILLAILGLHLLCPLFIWAIFKSI